MEIHRRLYPWAEQRLWYNPVECKDIYIEHYNFWMKHHVDFVYRLLHRPMTSGPMKETTCLSYFNARCARIRFINFCIRSWGLRTFIHLLEDEDHDDVF